MRPATRSATAANRGAHSQSQAVSKKRKYNASDETENPARKKPRQYRWKKKRGLIQDLLDMPLDIVFEVFSHLSPLDLLRLARTSKDLRAMLMSRSSMSVWKAARSNVLPIMPDCPPTMSEPEFAHFSFPDFCHYCGQPTSVGPVAVQWVARRVICQVCLPVYCVSGTVWSTDNNIPEAVSISKVFRGFDFRRIVPCFGPATDAGPEPEGHALIEFLTIWEAEGKKMRTIKQRTKWLEKKCKELKEESERSEPYCNWQRDRVDWVKAERERRVQNRLARLAERAREIGWGDELDSMAMAIEEESFEHQQQARELCANKLADSGWPLIDQYINTHMEAVKSRRLKYEREQLYSSRIPILRVIREEIVRDFPYLTRPSMPTVGELWAQAPIRKIILEHPKGEELTKADLAPTVTAVFTELNEQLQRRIDEELLDKVRSGLEEMEQNDREVDPDTVFNLATTIFHCCGERLFWFRDIKAHECASSLPFPKPLFKEFQYAYEYLSYGEKYHGHTRSEGCYTSFNVKASKIAKEVVEMCGLDPLTTTIKAMDDLDPIFECRVCSSLDHSKGRCSMNWRTVIAHHAFRPHNRYSVPPEQLEPDLDVMDDEDAEVARERIDEHQRRHLFGHGLLNVCAHCDQLFMPLGELVRHVIKEHGVEEVNQEDMLPEPTKEQWLEPFYMWPPWPLTASR